MQGSVMDMTDDISTGIAWALSHASKYGGDPNSLYLMGQSAGGHLAALTLLQKIQRRLAQDCGSREASPGVHGNSGGTPGFAAHGRVSGDALAMPPPLHRRGSEAQLRLMRSTLNTSASGRVLERWGPDSIKARFLRPSLPMRGKRFMCAWCLLVPLCIH